MSSDSNIRKNYKKLKNYQDWKEELEIIWKVKANVVPVVIKGFQTVTAKLEECLQQIPEATSELSI